MVHQKIVNHAGDAIAAGAAVGFGVKLLADVELIISIIAGLAVAVSAGLSIYLNYRDRIKNKSDDQE
jgi:hypothetical protein